MKAKGDSKPIGSIHVEFDDNFSATAQGGAALAEKTMRALGVRRAINTHLGQRSPDAQIDMATAVYAMMASMIVGGQGLQVCEALRDDGLLAKIFGLGQVPSPATIYRVLCDLSGLLERDRADCYVPSGPQQASLDMLGKEVKPSGLHRIVADEPERASDEKLAELENFGVAIAKRCAQALGRDIMRLGPWYVGFGDATDLEVDGRCFDAAQIGRDGKPALRWQTVMLGPVIVASRLGMGNDDEGRTMPDLLAKARATIADIVGRKSRILMLLDAAYFEKAVVDDMSWDFIVCANQQRDCLTRLALERGEREWWRTGPDASRGWADSHVCCFMHLPGGWQKQVTIVARRWRKDDELPGTWRYSFLATRIEPRDVPADMTDKHGYCQSIWMLYGTKQGRETHYKTALRDFNLHHPPSGRLGIDQAFYALATAAANIAMTMRYRVVPAEDRGMEFWRLRERYFAIAGYLVRRGRSLKVWLSGGCVDARRQTFWYQAWAATGLL